MGVEYDFSGWATRNDVKCDDGRTIRKNAFKECDGKTVPLVWSHIHDDPEMVLGHGILKNEPEGVRIYGKLNDSPKGRHTRMLIESGDIVGLSIWANQLKETRDRDVLHGSIREVSVVLAGANPGAYIDNVFIAHGAEGGEDEAIISLVDEPIEINHDGFVLNDEDFLSHVTDDEGEEEEPKEEKKPEVSGPIITAALLRKYAPCKPGPYRVRFASDPEAVLTFEKKEEAIAFASELAALNGGRVIKK
jgi:HK97 family phage prohead protease